MIRDVGVETFAQTHVYETMSADAETPLYVGSTKFTGLSAILRLMNLKAINGWTDKSFTELLELLNEMLPGGNTLPTQMYDVKKILCPMGMKYKRIHACPNDCILYRKEFEDLKKCPKCGSSRYKQKRNSEDSGQIEKEGYTLKVVWYLPIVPKLKRFFANNKDTKNLRWHATERRCDGLLRHPADSMQWKNIDKEFPKFDEECRNIRFGLATDESDVSPRVIHNLTKEVSDIKAQMADMQPNLHFISEQLRKFSHTHTHIHTHTHRASPRFSRPPQHDQAHSGEEEELGRPFPRQDPHVRRQRCVPPHPKETRIDLPPIHGKDNVEAYLDWVEKVEQLFDTHVVEEERRVFLTVLSFQGHALNWLASIVLQKRRKGLLEIEYWFDLKEVLHARHVHTYCKRELMEKLQRLQQRSMSVEEYRQKMEL